MAFQTRAFFSGSNPWSTFLWLTAANGILSYLPLSGPMKGIVLIGGVILPIVLATRSGARPSKTPVPVFQQEFLPTLPSWIFFLFSAVVVFTHFYRLDGPFPWPSGDEGLNALYSIGLSEKWDWRPFYLCGQQTPVLYWVASLLFRFFPDSLLDMRLPSALLSISIIPLGYLAYRTVFSRSLSLLAACLTGLSLWAFGFGRWFQLSTLILPWELVCFWLTGRLLREKDPSRSKRWAILLGFVAGLCYLTFPSWPFVLLAVLVLLLFGFRSRLAETLSLFPYFSIPFLLAFSPQLFAVVHGDYSLFNRVLSSFGNPISLGQRTSVVLSYFSSLLGGPLNGVDSFFVDRFERLNPIWGAAFLLGWTQLFKRGSRTWFWGTASLFLAFTLPAFLSSYLEILRVITVFPLLMGVTACGFGALLAGVRKEKRVWVLSLLLFFSTAIDGAWIVRIHEDPLNSASGASSHTINLQNRPAYQILRYWEGQKGPGLIFTEFFPDGKDYTLYGTTYGFNAAANPRLGPDKATWAALLTDRHYYPFLAPRLSGARYYWVGKGIPGDGEKEMLAVMPVDGEKIPYLRDWMKAQLYFLNLERDINNISAIRSTYDRALATLKAGPDSIGTDRFLRSLYWEKAADFYYTNDFRSHYQDLVDCLQKSVEEGVPSAHLYYKLGGLYLRKRNFAEAEKALRMGLKTEPGNADILSALSLIKEMKEQGRGMTR